MKVKDDPFVMSNILKINLPSTIEKPKFRKVAWMPLYSTFNTSSVGYISRKALSNRSP